jgi:hypothetical protein
LRLQLTGLGGQGMEPGWRRVIAVEEEGEGEGKGRGRGGDREGGQGGRPRGAPDRVQANKHCTSRPSVQPSVGAFASRTKLAIWRQRPGVDVVRKQDRGAKGGQKLSLLARLPIGLPPNAIRRRSVYDYYCRQRRSEPHVWVLDWEIAHASRTRTLCGGSAWEAWQAPPPSLPLAVVVSMPDRTSTSNII